MHPDELDLRRIELLKDALIAEYHARVARWNLLHQAGLALLGLAGYGLITGALTLDQTVLAAGVSLASIVFGAVMLAREEEDFELKLQRLLREIERLKRNRR